MLARRSKAVLKGGRTLDTPKLIPSFTSKGFPFFKEGGVERSEATRVLQQIEFALTDGFLVSGYDLFHKHLENPEPRMNSTEFVVIDSGGYELSSDFDSTSPKQLSKPPKPYCRSDYECVLRELNHDLPLMVANPDWETEGDPIVDQIATAQEFFGQFPQHNSTVILKRCRKKDGKLKSAISVDEIVLHIEKLRRFDVIGVTEKELGKNLLDRLRNLAKLRRAMDRADISAPIHVWGGLDPAVTPLYFFVGAELFDGASWLRYAFHRGVAVYRDTPNVLVHGIETPLDHSRILVLLENLRVLRVLSTELQSFVDARAERFDMFQWNSVELESAYRVLQARVPELKEAK